MEALSIDVTVPRRAFTVQVELTAGPEVLALVGPSGAGKTTVLRAVAGLERPSRGRIALGDEIWLSRGDGRTIDLPPERRSVGLVPQDHGLFPHLDVHANVAFGAGGGAGAARRRAGVDVDALLDRMGIGHLADEKPARLSGGERQRVALARALARAPQVLALDEPLGALDAHTRAQVRGEVRETLSATGLPALLVTHDFGDAAALATRVAVIAGGRIVQTGTPSDLIARPADRFVAAFTGAAVLDAHAGADGAVVAGGTPTGITTDLRGPVGLALRASQVAILEDRPPDGRIAVRAAVSSVVAEGARARVELSGGLAGECAAELAPRLGPGREVWAAFAPDEARVVAGG